MILGWSRDLRIATSDIKLPCFSWSVHLEIIFTALKAPVRLC